MILIRYSSQMSKHTFWRRSCSRHVLKCCLALLSAVVTSHPARAVELVASAPLWNGVAAFPRVAGDDAAVKRINETLHQADKRLDHAARECAETSRLPHDPGAAWERKIRVTTRGPDFLSLVTDDISFCGGAHPNSDTLALVFDLRTGELVNWRMLLPTALVSTFSLKGSMDGSKVGMVTSDELSRTYQALYPAQSQSGMSKEDWSECRQAVATAQYFLLWPEVKPRGLTVKPADLVHVVAGCGVPVVVPTTTLRTLGAKQQLTESLDAGH